MGVKLNANAYPTLMLPLKNSRCFGSAIENKADQLVHVSNELIILLLECIGHAKFFTLILIDGQTKKPKKT